MTSVCATTVEAILVLCMKCWKHDNVIKIYTQVCVCPQYTSVPARLGKGQGAKEIGHNLACERP